MAEQEHYFAPGREYPAKRIAVTLAGRNLQVWTSGGTFSPDHVDTGTATLLEELGRLAPEGPFLDLGCGWGPIALSLALLRPESRVYAVDVNDSALELLRRSGADLGVENIEVLRPEGVPGDVRFAQIWSNPPIRIGKAALHSLLLEWLPRLAPAGSAYLVVQKQLGADSLLDWLRQNLGAGWRAERIATEKGFRVLEVCRV